MARWFALGLFGLYCLSLPAYALEIGIVTGSENGTYYQIGQNIRELVQQQNSDIQLNVYPTTGSLENVEAVYKRRGVQLGIVQSDVLGFIQEQSDNTELQRIVRKTRLVFPLYNEEVHILVPREA